MGSLTSEADKVHVEPNRHIQLGDWFTFADDDGDTILAAVSKIGSNHVELTGLPLNVLFRNRASRSIYRKHANILHTLTPAPDWQALIMEQVNKNQAESLRIMQEVEAITRRLGVQPRHSMIASDGLTTTGTSLSVLSGTEDMKAYQLALKSAHESDLPTLFESMKGVQECLSHWMRMPMLPLEIAQEQAGAVMAPLKERIFQVGLYSGLAEEAVQVASGEPAAYHDKLHVFQLKRFMDEECLLNYQAGGIDIQNLGAFDRWLALPENRDRILPFPRCMVAMQVRRRIKERDYEGSLRQLNINVELGNLDRLTFLFVRNGENLYRINTEIDFPDLIFPTSPQFMGGEALMFKSYGSGRHIAKEGFITVRSYEQMVQEEAEMDRQREVWYAENPYPAWAEIWRAQYPDQSPRYTEQELRRLWERDNPFYYKKFSDLNCYRALTPDALYYDEAMEIIAREEREFNRIAIILQGLLDRSEVLHPHPPVDLGTQAGCETMLVLVKDGSTVLTHGEAPDFEAYRARLNAQITPDSLFTGQDKAWALKEGEKETRRMNNSWRERTREWRPTYFRPYDDPGPGDIAHGKKVFFDKNGCAIKVVFSWRKQKRTDVYGHSTVEKTVTVPVTDLLNVSAYRLGDYKQFFADPRTRAEYLQWAPLLLEAEKWHQNHRQEA